jgi:hypothetical protein
MTHESLALARILANPKETLARLAELERQNIALGMMDFEVIRQAIRQRDELADKQSARIAQLEAERQWRPIDQAPKDGTPILLLNLSRQGWIVFGRWNADFERWETMHGIGYGNVTHYLPAPAPPI